MICLVIAIPFIRARVKEHQAINQIYRDVGETVELSASEHILLVNAPAFLATPEPTFLLGAEGTTYLPDFVNINDWLRLNRFDMCGQVTQFLVDDVVPPNDYLYTTAHSVLDRTTIRNYEQVIAVNSYQDELRALLVGEQINTVIENPLADFGNGIVLGNSVLSDNGELILTWQLNAPLQNSVSIFVHLICNDELISQADGAPLGRLYDFSLWEQGEAWMDYRYFDTDTNIETCHAFVGLFDSNTGVRFQVETDSGEISDGIIIKPN